ncbi:glycosyltransferase [Spirulina subsalsa FACHB-351]|uniref:Glycosyltransferase n=2 Tax=Spirulina subsalsa TaxID=54311 RepID=A0ABT3L5Z8_9CYAN|nr:glycosyltransferase [Spirulina subsalsa]MCW6036933.1 glycosyltransferase [Spirulina subsalsa FACHB-351]
MSSPANGRLRFLGAASLTTAFNLVLISILIEQVQWPTNLANLVAVELSLLFGFLAYRLLVWSGGNWQIQDVLLKQIPLYHVSHGAALLGRILVIFPLLNAWGVHYGVNTLVGVIFGGILNYLVSDRILPEVRRSHFHYPEALAPSLVASGPRAERPDSLPPVDLLSIVIPAYNEEGSISPTVHKLSQRLEEADLNYEILVVNDNSRDRTEQILQQLHQENPRVRYINNYYPNGFGFAVRCGVENFQGDAVIIYMGDSSDSPDNIVDYYEQLQAGYECVFGSRFIQGSKIVDYPTHKLLINRLANWFVKVLFGLDYNDTTNAFKAYRKEVIQGISPLLSHHFNLTVEMPLKAIVRGYSYTIVPITWHNRKAGVSKLKIKEMGSRYLFIVLSIFLEQKLAGGDYHRSKNPVAKSPVNSRKTAN